ncbi:FAD-dependent oxidoreductase [Rothia sp. (in: high G+C Gram-positive bacteria)]|uniref:FAD-dependent oxidoreductase n=1 Tax=Rothia sp. (in: high G+C Gram-positive bacteria) TaxID=1885016 RepID=UPI003217D1B2
MNQAQKTVVIVGGVAGGMSAATRLRRHDESMRIIVLEKSGYVSFANCGLPYYLGGVIEERDSLLLQTPESLAQRFELDVRVNSEVLSIDRAAQAIDVKIAAGTETLNYDELILSPGATPFVPPLPGVEQALTLRTVEDVDAIMARTHELPSGASVAVVGGGFVGLEVAENLSHRGFHVSLVEAAPHVMAPLDTEIAALVHRALRDGGVDLYLGEALAEIRQSKIKLASGSEVPADMVILAIGVRPDSRLAAGAGLALSERGGILVDEHMRTSDPHIYAVGDAVEKRDALSGQGVLVALANTANLQGRLVADVIAGRPVAQRPVRGTSILGLFGMTAASVGWNERRLKQEGRDYRAIHTHPSDHAGYYPGASGMSLKLLVDSATDEILGAQGVGESGVDKRIDVIATAMAGGLRASDLAELELAYSPQFGSAKDPVNMLGYINRNIRDGLVQTVQFHELQDELDAGALLVDVRTPGEFTHSPIPGAVNIELDALRERLGELEIDRPIIVHCQVGLRGYLAARILNQHGYQVRNLDGGWKTWNSAQQ